MMMDWFYLTPAPIDYDAWEDTISGDIDINVTKYEDKFKYGEKESNREMMKNIPEFKKDGVPILKLEFGRFYAENLFWYKKDILATMEMVYPECDIIRKILNRVEDCRMYQTSVVCYPLLMFDQHVLNMVRQYCGPVCMEAIQTIANPCEIPLDLTSEEFDRKNQMSLKVRGQVYHFKQLTWEKAMRSGRGYVMRVMGCPINWLDSYLKKDLTSLMRFFEKVAPAAGFPEVYSLMRTHHLDRKITDLARMGLDLLQRTGLTCNDKAKVKDLRSTRYVMEQCDAGKYMSTKGCKSCPGVSYSAAGAYGAEQCDRTNAELITCRPVKVRQGFGTLECTSETPISCTYACPENTFFSRNETVYAQFNFTCNESTNKWSHQNSMNMFGRVPNCAEIRLPSPKLEVAIKFDASECPTNTQLSTCVKEYFTTAEVDSYSCFKATDKSKCAVKQVTCEALESSIEIKMIVNQEASEDITELENVKSKLVEEATAKTLTLTYSSDSRRKKREVETLNSNGDVEAEEIAAECEPGYETINEQCLSCAAGTYESDGTCTECPAFTYNDLDAATECSVCPDGYYTFGGGHDSLADCIEPCSEGWYRDEVTMSCVACPEGTSSAYNSSSIDSCEGCPVGEYFYNETSQCEKCPLASYNDQTDRTSCTSCTAGWFTNGDGKTSSTDCMEPCLPGKYMDLTAGECTACPEGFTSLPNATSSYACDLTVEEFVEIIEENAAEFEEMAAEGGIDLDDLEEAVEAIEDELATESTDDTLDAGEVKVEDSDDSDNGDYSVHRCGYGYTFWLGLLVLKLNLIVL